MTRRPVLYVLAGVNGAGKSSVGGHMLRRVGLDWFNPDTYARALMRDHAFEQTDANAEAWHEGMRRLASAVTSRSAYAFETTLGGRTVPTRIAAAAVTHDVAMWFCGLSSPEQHVARVRSRVAAGGHDIPEAKIRERYVTALENLIALMPHLATLRVFDNSMDAGPGGVIADPRHVADITYGHLTWPTDMTTLQQTPVWAKPVLEAAMSGDDAAKKKKPLDA